MRLLLDNFERLAEQDYFLTADLTDRETSASYLNQTAIVDPLAAEHLGPDGFWDDCRYRNCRFIL